MATQLRTPILICTTFSISMLLFCRLASADVADDLAARILDSPPDQVSAARSAVLAELMNDHGGGTPAAFEIASQVQVKLGGDTLKGLGWRDHAIPVLLQDSFGDTSLIVASVSPSASLPQEWVKASAWITPWIVGRDLPNHAVGFAKPIKDGLLPGALHPLSVRLSRQYLRDQLARPEGDLQVRAFLEWITTQLGTSPDTALSAGDLVVVTCEAKGVKVAADGTVSGPDEWKSLVERVLDAVVVNSEAGEGTPTNWRGRSQRIRELLDACPPWNQTDRGMAIRKRAQKRVTEASKALGTVFASGASALPLNVNLLEDVTQTLTSTPRFATPFVAVNSPAREQYLRSLNSATLAVNVAGVDLERTRQANRLAARWRQEYRSRIESPVLLSEIIPATAPSGLPHVAALDGIRRANARMSLRQLRESITGADAWPSVVNQRVDTGDEDAILAAWAAIDMWDSLRAKGMADNTGEAAFVQEIYQSLPSWLRRDEALPPNAGDTASSTNDPWKDVRPKLAGLAVLGILPASDRDALVNRMESLLAQLNPSSALFTTLAAARIELAVTEGTVPGIRAVAPLGDLSATRMAQWRQWSVVSLASGSAWECRAGMNGVILLARIAQLSGNPAATATSSQALKDSPRASNLVAKTVDALLVGKLTLARSDLPLALAACDLSRLHREAADSISPQATDAFASRPEWLARLQSTPSQFSQVIDQLADTLALDPQMPDKVVAFLTQARLPSQMLLLAVTEARLGDLQRSLRFRIAPLRSTDPDLVKLARLRATMRLLYGGNGVLLDEPERLASVQPLVPWWVIAFWTRPNNASVSPVDTPPKTRVVLSAWTPSIQLTADEQLLSLAAALESSIPRPDPARPVDIDGRADSDFPRFTWAKAEDDFKKAIGVLKETETAYAEAIKQQNEAQQAAELVQLLKQPLLLDVADHMAQIKAAVAEVRAAEAELEASRHDALATELESIAADLIYDAAKVELERQTILVDVANLDKQIEELEEEAVKIEERVVQTDKEITEKLVDLNNNHVKRAQLTVKMAQDAAKGVRKRIMLLRSLLLDPLPHQRPDGSTITVPGRIGKMGAQIEDSLTKKLAEDLAEAQRDLTEERDKEANQKKLERQRQLVNAVSRFAGAVVGFVIGGPAGAALGAEIGGAVGEIANGVLENRPPEKILVGLVDNAFAIAEKAGVNLAGELNGLGEKGAGEADEFFAELNTTLGPLLETLPRVLDDRTMTDAMMALGLEGDIPQFTQLLRSSYADLKREVAGLGKLGDALRAAGIENPVVTDNPQALLDHLSDTLFQKTRDNAEQIQKLGQRMGVQLASLSTEDGQREACNRLAKVVITRVGLETAKYRSDTIRQWAINKQQAGLTWYAVKDEGNALINAIYPDPKDRADVLASLEMTLLDKETLQAEVELAITPWQKGLDEQIRAISEACDKVLRDNPPSSAVDAAQARINYIRQFQARFLGVQPDGTRTKGLVDWLKGESLERGKLLLDLKALEEDALKKLDQLTADGEILNAAVIARDVAEDAHKKAKLQTEKLAVFRKQVKVKLEKASLLVRVADLSKLESGKEMEAKEQSAKASKEKASAATARITAAEARLLATRAREEGVRQRAGVARRIESALSLPPLEQETNALGIPQGVIAEARFRHANAIEAALAAYRELLRHLRIAGLDATQFPKADFTLAARENVRLRWSVSLESQYLPKITDSLFTDTGFKPTIEPIRLELSDKHIARLFSTGLKITVRPGVTTSFDGERILIESDQARARSGRVLVLMLMGKTESGTPIGGAVHIRSKTATYLGDRWIAPDLPTLTPRQEYPSRRFILLDPMPNKDAIDAWVTLENIKPLAGLPGDPRFEEVEGTPLSGTVVIRCEATRNSEGLPAMGNVKRMELIIVYVYYGH